MNSNRVFFIDAPGGLVTISNLTIAHGRAKGGDGGIPLGGGGAGLGGGIFVNQGSVTVAGVDFIGNAAHGGRGGEAVGSYNVSGGGGGGWLVTEAPARWLRTAPEGRAEAADSAGRAETARLPAGPEVEVDSSGMAATGFTAEAEEAV